MTNYHVESIVPESALWCRMKGVVKQLTEDPIPLFERLKATQVHAHHLRLRRGCGTAKDVVIFHDPPAGKEDALVGMSLPMLFNPRINGLENTLDLTLATGAVIAARYRIVKKVGTGSFSTVYQCTYLTSSLSSGPGQPSVCVKVVKNTKDCFDSACGEIRVLALIRQHGGRMHHLLRLHCFMYWREHIVIVTDLEQESLFECYRSFASDDDRLRFFSQSTMAALSSQMLEALIFLHELGIAHCDVKTENICIRPTRTCQFTLIDFGSAVLTYDVHNSYVQSRWYRAPEVMLGLPWDPKVDVWSLGCVLPEILLGQPVFRRSSVEGVLAAQIAVLGPIPEYMMQFSPELATMFLTATGHAYEIDPQGLPEGVYYLSPLPQRQLAKLLKNAVLPVLFGGELDGFLDHVYELLTIDPQNRPTAVAASQHYWLASQTQPGGP